MKGLVAAMQVLVARLTRAGALAASIRTVREWSSRTRRSGKSDLGEDVLKLSGAIREQQLVVEAFNARHPLA